MSNYVVDSVNPALHVSHLFRFKTVVKMELYLIYKLLKIRRFFFNI